MSANSACGRHLRRIACATLCVLLIGSATRAAERVAFEFTITDQPGVGFNDPVLGPQRLAAVEHAGQLWSQLLKSSYADETLRVDLSMDLQGNFLGSALSAVVWRGFSGLVPSTWYSSSLTNHLVGGDVDASRQEFRMRFSPTAPWYYGTDGNPASDQYDLVTVAMHEIMHGLNINSRMGLGDGTYDLLDLPGIYDRFLVADPVNNLTLPEMNVAGRAAAITSDSLYWYGPNAVAANGGVRPKLHAPAVFETGHSLTHLDPDLFPDALMRGASANATKLGDVTRPSAVELGMLTDMGWTIVPEPSAALLLLVGLHGLTVCGRLRVL